MGSINHLVQLTPTIIKLAVIWSMATACATANKESQAANADNLHRTATSYTHAPALRAELTAQEGQRFLVVPTIGASGKTNDVVSNYLKNHQVESPVSIGEVAELFQDMEYNQSVNDILFVTYQSEFARIVSDRSQSGALAEAIELPGDRFYFTQRVPRRAAEARLLVRALSRAPEKVQSIRDSIALRTFPDAIQPNHPQFDIYSITGVISAYSMAKLGVTHLVMSHVDRSEAEFNRGMPLRVSVGVIDVESGVVKYFTQSIIERHNKGKPGSYSQLLSSVVSEVLDRLKTQGILAKN